MTTTTDDLRDEVRRRYAAAALAAERGGCGCSDDGGCCGNVACDGADGSFGDALYDAEERGQLPAAAALASLGCGNPTAVAELRPGETVLDLGSGGGIDVILSAKRVGPDGIAFGLDMTDEMLALARRNAAEAGVRNAIFLKGEIEDVPLPAQSVDVVISNCVINLSTDKAAVLTEIARVLKPGGRIGVSDVVARERARYPVGELRHQLGDLGMDGGRRLRAGAARLAALPLVERLRHLRAACVLHADEKDALHVAAPRFVALTIAPCIPSATSCVKVTLTSPNPAASSPCSYSRFDSAPAIQPT